MAAPQLTIGEDGVLLWRGPGDADPDAVELPSLSPIFLELWLVMPPGCRSSVLRSISAG